MKGFSFKKLFLDLLVVACLGVAVWSGYVLFTHQINPVWGTVILLVDIGVLIWNISVLCNRRWKWRNPKFKWVFLSILVILMVCAFGGVQPLSTYKDKVVGMFTSATSEWGINQPTTPIKVTRIDNWEFSLYKARWDEGTVIVNLAITNHSSRRNFGYASFIDVGPELAAIDHTGKLVEPWVRPPDFQKGELFTVPSYTKEFYPEERWEGELKFRMSPYSKDVKLYITRYYHSRKAFLFDLGSP